jgi:hypothetical protein
MGARSLSGPEVWDARPALDPPFRCFPDQGIQGKQRKGVKVICTDSTTTIELIVVIYFLALVRS